MMDADMSTPIQEIEKFIPDMDVGHPVLIGTRKSRDALITQRQPLFRETLGKAYTLLARHILGVKVTDFTCGFKCFSAEAAQSIFSKAEIDRWSYDAELLFIAKNLKLSIREIPVIWHNDEDSRVRLSKDALSSLIDLFKIRFKR
ncbi:hypothetical protein COX00_03465 [Candidatus Uhrbacteria bacterium CG22_combo_CG10-13_8_21_14_all_47_17]|uniref:Glycosyltransferase 2-like domain-containing protein n=1 Tax=Candidatus Uhrbacteria bacterium CG22_combo_CG10-13_8_21_14_all_47_17 TaxID=1975041 RepID=A0A2H0BRV3_9BACT|nr:MAG: hypothetical protein COX00_03465 [Candidatus Uhrbacteria bacterium CG22_combo_CG10-13_8_21_14_all_47_17]